MIGPNNSRAPFSAALIGVSPSWMWRSTFSTTTIASSTTKPTARTIASRVNKLRVKPKSSIRKIAPINETGMARTGAITARSDPIKRKMTITTMQSVSISVSVTSWIALLIYSVESYGMSNSMPVGSCFWISGSAALTDLITSKALAVGRTKMPMKVAVFPENRTSES